MYEIKYVQQRQGERLRRWFTDDYWDLFIWIEETGEISEFQLCYGKPNEERALDWNRNRGYRHSKVSESSSGRIGPSMETPILVQDGLFSKETTTERFLNDSTGIDPKVRDFVHQKIRDFDL
ncbi:MAG: hypothetical protein HN368_22690 [Spirochaetales bacterium]|jgi:hypothetical protein|nr:hypothetical protein [Spirochaetales bacterium]